MGNARRYASAEERTVVRWMLEHAAREPGPGELIATVDRLEIAERCDCGCPSVEFVKEGQGAGAQILADATGRSNDGEPFSVILWGKEGKISGLEVFDYDGGAHFPLPHPDTLRRSLPFDNP